jgi:hypothetical protein
VVNGEELGERARLEISRLRLEEGVAERPVPSRGQLLEKRSMEAVCSLV